MIISAGSYGNLAHFCIKFEPAFKFPSVWKVQLIKIVGRIELTPPAAVWVFTVGKEPMEENRRGTVVGLRKEKKDVGSLEAGRHQVLIQLCGICEPLAYNTSCLTLSLTSDYSSRQ